MYLTDKNRKFYSDAIMHIQNCQDEFWSIDNHINIYLNEINKNHGIRTLYSKSAPSPSSLGNQSCLQFCYTKELEVKIDKDLILLLKSEFDSDKGKKHLP